MAIIGSSKIMLILLLNKHEQLQCSQEPPGRSALEGLTEAGLIEAIISENFEVDPASFDVEERRVGIRASSVCTVCKCRIIARVH